MSLFLAYHYVMYVFALINEYFFKFRMRASDSTNYKMQELLMISNIH